MSRTPAGSGEMPASASHMERGKLTDVAGGEPVAASTVALAREIRGRLRMGIGRRVIHRARRVSLSEPRSLAQCVAPLAPRHVQMTPLPLAGEPLPGAGLDVTEGVDIEPRDGAAFGQSTGDAAWDALWALRGARSVSDVGPGPAQEPAAASGQRPTQRATDQETVANLEESADGRAESSAAPRGVPVVPAKRQPASRRVQTQSAQPGVTRPETRYPAASRPLGRRVTELGTVRHPQAGEASSPVAPGVEPGTAAPEPRLEAPVDAEPAEGSILASRANLKLQTPPLPSAESAVAADAPRGAALPAPSPQVGVSSTGEAEEAAGPSVPEGTAEGLPAHSVEGARRQLRQDVRQRGRSGRVQRARHGMPETGPGEYPEGTRDTGADEMQASTPGHGPEAVSGAGTCDSQEAPEAQGTEQAAPPPHAELRSQPEPALARSTAGVTQAVALPPVRQAGSAPTQTQVENAAPTPEPLLRRPQAHVGPVPVMHQRQPVVESASPLIPGQAMPPTPTPSARQALQRETDGEARPQLAVSHVEALPEVPARAQAGSPVGTVEHTRPSRLLAGLRRLLPLRGLARQHPPASGAIERAQVPSDDSGQRSARESTLAGGQQSTVDGHRSAVRDLESAVSVQPSVVSGQPSSGEVPIQTTSDLARRTIDSHRLEPLLRQASPAPLPLAGTPLQRAAVRQASSRPAGPDVISSLVEGLDRQMPEGGSPQRRASGPDRGAGERALPGLAQTVGGQPAAAGPVVQRAIRGPRDLQQIRQSTLQPTLQPMMVQRVASDAPGASASSAANAAGPGPADAGPGSPGQGEEQDLETMAQEVYRIIRRRLAIERERARGGL